MIGSELKKLQRKIKGINKRIDKLNLEKDEVIAEFKDKFEILIKDIIPEAKVGLHWYDGDYYIEVNCCKREVPNTRAIHLERFLNNFYRMEVYFGFEFEPTKEEISAIKEAVKAKQN